jgi:hypothetical protein
MGRTLCLWLALLGVSAALAAPVPARVGPHTRAAPPPPGPTHDTDDVRLREWHASRCVYFPAAVIADRWPLSAETAYDLARDCRERVREIDRLLDTTARAETVEVYEARNYYIQAGRFYELLYRVKHHLREAAEGRDRSGSDVMYARESLEDLLSHAECWLGEEATWLGLLPAVNAEP